MLNRRDGLAETRIYPICYRFKHNPGKISSRQTGISVACHSAKYIRGEPAAGSATIIHHSYGFHVISYVVNGLANAHLFGNIVAHAPKIDDIPACPQFWRFFNNRYFMPIF
ncbi:hypothetical protein HY30_06925 [Hyphomonas chukchiensis]|uniref:Uncharacterized protein n=1 Tax=Hyphomonas chukchiensis TaxID=1280947 RepID=A0A062UE44_9PROT|nr:hypothetical protein HY30_06925 [Hyphomonas chukchiensis]